MNNRRATSAGKPKDSRSDNQSLEADSAEMLEAMAFEELNLSSHGDISRKKTSTASALDFSYIDREKRTGKEIFNDLIASVAQEETSVAHLIQAQARNIDAFTGGEGEFPTSPSNQQIIDFQNAVARVIEALVEKQKILLRMVEMSNRLLDQDAGDDG